MKSIRLIREQHGVTLMEITLAVAIFAAVIGATAHALMSFYVGIDMQEQRIEGVAACRSVMDGIREKRYEFRDNFPEGLVAWIESNNDSSWEAYLADNSEHTELAVQSIAVVCLNEAGGAAGAGDNPIVVYVTTEWRDRKGRPMSATVVSMLTDE